MDKAHYEDGYDYPDEKGYKDFNVAQNDKGLWWAVSVNPDADPMAQMSCNDQRPVWVPNGQTPPAGTGHVITPEMLSKLAANHTRVPGVTIETSPTDGQTVNLPTWVWLREDYTPVHVRAYVDLGGGRQIWAETTAEPVSVRIDPGTPDATVFPSSGQCPIGKDGSVGVKYTGNAEAAPPCGVTYRRSTQNRPPFQLNVTATWRVTWVGSDGGGVHPLADGVIDNPRPVTVQEIQSVNR
jgi:enoyl reductase